MRAHWFSLLFALASATSAEAEWPRWRGPTGDGRWNPPNLPKDIAAREPQLLWKVGIGGGYSGVTVSDGRVYVMDRPKQAEEIERLFCYTADTGERVWEHEWPAVYGSMDYGTGPRSSVTIHEGKVYALGAAGMSM